MSSLHRAILLAVLLAVTGGPAAGAGKAGIVKLATLAPDGTVWHKGLRQMGEEWGQVSEGRVSLRVYAGGVAGDESSVLRKMRIGQLDAATLTVAGLAEIDDGFQMLGVPLFFRSYEEMVHVLRELEPDLENRLATKGFVFLGWAYAGWVHLFSTEPVRSVADLRRLKIYVTAGEGHMTQLYKNAGFRPVSLSQTDILVGLETGLIEVLPTPPVAALLLQWFRSTPYMLDEGLAPLMGSLVITKRAWSRIETGDQRRLREAARRLEDRLGREIPVQDRESIIEMKKRGLTVTTLDPGKEAEWREVARTFSTRVQGSLVPQSIYDRALKAREGFDGSSRPAGGSD